MYVETNTGPTFDNYTGFTLLAHIQDSTIIRKIIFGLNEKDCESLNTVKMENLTILSLLSINLKVKMIKSVVRFKWLHFCPMVTRTLKILIYGTSLEVQWLRPCLPMQGAQVRSLVGELRSHMQSSAAKKKDTNL